MADYAMSYATGLTTFFRLHGLSPARTRIRLDETHLNVRMGWAFRASIPRTSIVSVERDSSPVYAWGVHGWRGSYLVNASSEGIVRVDIDPAARARLMGIPIQLRRLRLSLEEPDDFVRELGRTTAG